MSIFWQKSKCLEAGAWRLPLLLLFWLIFSLSPSWAQANDTLPKGAVPEDPASNLVDERPLDMVPLPVAAPAPVGAVNTPRVTPVVPSPRVPPAVQPAPIAPVVALPPIPAPPPLVLSPTPEPVMAPAVPEEPPAPVTPSPPVVPAVEPPVEVPPVVVENIVPAPEPTAADSNASAPLDRDALFRKIFKKAPPPRLRQYEARLLLDDAPVETVSLRWNALFTEFQFVSPLLQKMLDSILVTDKKSALKSTDGLFQSDALRALGFELDLDETEYVLHVSVPGALRALQRHPLQARSQTRPAGQELQPAFFSAYLNAIWTQSASYNERFFDDDSTRLRWESYNGRPHPRRERLQGDLNGAVRTLDWVLLGTATIREPEQGSFDRRAVTRGSNTLIHDFLNENSRLRLWDVSASQSGANFQIPSLGGASLQMGEAIRSDQGRFDSEVQFYLQQPALVSVLINGEVTKAMRLSSGLHEITAFAGKTGVNDVELLVEYDSGEKERIPYRFVQPANQVRAPGHEVANVTAGTPRLGENEYQSDWSEMVVAGAYSKGLGAFVNADFSLAVQKNLQVGGLRLLWLEDSVSTWSLGATVSYDSLTTRGHSWSLQYGQRVHSAQVSASVRYANSTFHNAFYQNRGVPEARYLLGLNVGAPVWRGQLNFNANMIFNRQIDSLSSPIDYSFGTSYGFSVWGGLNVSAMGNCVIQSGEFTPSASLTLSYFFNKGNHSIYALSQTNNEKKYSAPSFERTRVYDTSYVANEVVVIPRDTILSMGGDYHNEWVNMGNVGWSWSEGMGVLGGKALSVNGNIRSDQYGVRLGAQRTTNFADLSASYSMSDQDILGLKSRSHYLSARASTSLLFADGLFGLGRPVYDGFVLVDGQHELESTTFRVNPSDMYNSEYSRGRHYLPASYGLISAYNTTSIQVVPVNAPTGVMIETDRFYMNNTYKQGYVLRMGKPPRVLARLRLIDETSQVLEYVNFRVLNAQDTSVVLYQSFSNKFGVIQIADLLLGQQYIIRFGEDAFVKDLVITIPKDAPRILNLGDMKVEHQSLSKLSKLSMNTAIAPVPLAETVAQPPAQLLPEAPLPPVTEELPPSIAPPASANY